MDKSKTCDANGGKCRRAYREVAGGWYCPQCRTVDSERLSPVDSLEYKRFKKFVSKTLNEDSGPYYDLFSAMLRKFLLENKKEVKDLLGIKSPGRKKKEVKEDK